MRYNNNFLHYRYKINGLILLINKTGDTGDNLGNLLNYH